MKRLTAEQRLFAEANYGLVASARKRFGGLIETWRKRCRWLEQDDILIPAYMIAVATWQPREGGGVAFSTWFFWRVRDQLSNWAKRIAATATVEQYYARAKQYTSIERFARLEAADELDALGLRRGELELLTRPPKETAKARRCGAGYIRTLRQRATIRLRANHLRRKQ